MDVSRYLNTTELKFTIEFVTPTFLGGPDGNAQIRTAPFKSLLRRWWRIINGNLKQEELWQKESELFGSTEKNPYNKDKKGNCKVFGKSKIEIKLLNIEPENEYYYLSNKEIKKSEYLNKQNVNLAQYMGFGPINFKKKYVVPGTKAYFSILLPKNEENTIKNILYYINIFGTIGARSRHGWGSIKIIPDSFEFDNTPQIYTKDFNELLSYKYYPTAIGKDSNGLLCWRTVKTYESAEDAYWDMARLYYNLILELKFTDRKKGVYWRKILGGPIMNKFMPSFKKVKSRYPAQLQIKIIKHSENEYSGQITHVPYSIKTWQDKDGSQVDAWKYIYKFLDGNSIIHRIAEKEL